jgi:hypothetical protein
MDLRPKLGSKGLIQEAVQVLNYQPFLIADDFQTGAGYSWLHWPDPREAPPLVFNRADWSERDWENITASNQGAADHVRRVHTSYRAALSGR